MRCLPTTSRACLGSRKLSFTVSRTPIPVDKPGRVCRLAVSCGAGQDITHVNCTPVLPALLGAIAGLALGAPGASMAVEELVQQQVTEVDVVTAPVQQPSTFQLASDISQAPDLADVVVEPESRPDNLLVNGLEWVMVEGREVTNFTESNFAAVGAPSSSMWLSNSPWCLVWDAYCNVLSERPVATKLATGMVGTFLGDLLAQFTQSLVKSHNVATMRGRSKGSGFDGRADGVVGGSSRSTGAADTFALDLGRTARLVGFSALVGTPVAFIWFNLLDQFVMPTDPTNPLAVFSKVALDQVLMAPCMTSLFFATMAMLEGSKGNEVADTVKTKLKPTLLANWTVWPIAHVVNFALIPPAHRILYINVINIAWTAFMSHMASGSSGSAEGRAEEAVRVTSSKQMQEARR